MSSAGENAKVMKHIRQELQAEVQFNMNVILEYYALDCFNEKKKNSSRHT